MDAASASASARTSAPRTSGGYTRVNTVSGQGAEVHTLFGRLFSDKYLGVVGAATREQVEPRSVFVIYKLLSTPSPWTDTCDVGECQEGLSVK